MKKPSPRRFAVVLNLLFLLLSSTPPAVAAEPLQAELANGWTIELRSQLQPLVINRLHSWQLILRDSNGQPLNGASIEVTGGMPDHDHGLPTAPLVSATAEDGIYLLQGMRFHMPGYWQLRAVVEKDGFSDEVVFDLQL
ncbi:MAG: FixH family protein [Pseudomonadales bacterium]|nr:FixH family protein [Pseudomonadales bacterium]